MSETELSMLYSFLDAVRSAPERVASFRKTAVRPSQKGEFSQEYRDAVDAIVLLVEAIPAGKRQYGDAFRAELRDRAEQLRKTEQPNPAGKPEPQRIAADAILLAMR
jgi:hypothetical protein